MFEIWEWLLLILERPEHRLKKIKMAKRQPPVFRWQNFVLGESLFQN